MQSGLSCSSHHSTVALCWWPHDSRVLMPEYLTVLIDQAAQERTNRTVISHERTSVHFLVLPGSLFSFTEITEFLYISLI